MFDGAYLIRFSCPLLFTLEQAQPIVVTASNNKSCRLCCPLRRVLFLFFFYLSLRICRVSALLGQLCSLCLSLSSSSSSSHARVCATHLREYAGTSSSFHAYMPCEYTRTRCTTGNEHVIKERSFLDSFLALSSSLCNLF